MAGWRGSDQSSSIRSFMPDPTIEPALKVIREHRDVAKSEIQLAETEIEEVRREIEAASKRLKDLTARREQFTHELRAHERVLSQLGSRTGFNHA